jgi:hypothetical protein
MGNSILLLLEILSPCKLFKEIMGGFSFWILAWSFAFNDFVVFIYRLIYALALLHKNDLGHLSAPGWENYQH